MSIIPHQTPLEGWDAFNARKQKERNEAPPPDDNQPESRNLTSEERQIFANARAAVDVIKKTFETWMTIARGVEAARKRADAQKGGKKVFERILEQQGLCTVLGKTPASVHSTSVRLLKILDNELEVSAWRRGLTSWERIQWSSPTAVYKHCPCFQRQAELDGAKKERKSSTADRIKELEAENAHLHEELARHDTPAPPRLMRRDDRDRVIDMNDDAQDIAAAMRTLNADKAKDIARAIIGHKPGKPGKSKVKAKGGLKGFLDAWTPVIREALKDAEADLTAADCREVLSVIEHDISMLKERLAERTAELAHEPEWTFEDQLAQSLALAAAMEVGEMPPPPNNRDEAPKTKKPPANRGQK